MSHRRRGVLRRRPAVARIERYQIATWPSHPDLPGIPQATVVPRSRARISVVWIIPVLAAVVALGIAVQRILSEGPTIAITFKAAQGIEAGKTVVRYKDVNIGQVTKVELASDYSRVEVTAKIVKSAAGLMVEDARFWVVEPRVTLRGVSGLGTLLSGNYIGFEVGKSHKKQRMFTGLEMPPSSPAISRAGSSSSRPTRSARRSTIAACRLAR